MFRFREMGQTDSSLKLDLNLDFIEEDMQEIVFTRGCKGPIVTQDPHRWERSREQWVHCLIGFLLDDRSLSPR